MYASGRSAKPPGQCRSKNERVRRTLVTVVLALTVLGAGCSSQPSAVQVAQQNLEHWATLVGVDAKLEKAQCTQIAGSSAGYCSPSAALVAMTCSDEQHYVQAEVALHRVEEKPYSPDFPSCRSMG